MVSQDYEDLFRALNAFRIKYLVVGAHAVAFYTEPRFTKDMDVWVPPVLNDTRRVYRALQAFGAPLKAMKPDDFEDPSMILQIGLAPVRVDIMMDLPGVSAQEAWRRRKRTRYGKTPICILGLAELMRAKKAAGRPQDKLDLRRLLGRRFRPG